MNPSKATHPDEFVWAQKYRPNTLAEVIIPEALRLAFQQYVTDKALPTLLLHSPSPGTGKTTTAKALCNDLGVVPLFINASMENSIDDIRTKVFQYATTASLFGDSRKVVILDEAERLSPAAQDSLKGLVEQVSSNCVFILTCNTKSKIIDPLKSRCIEIDFVYSNEDKMRCAAQMLKRCMEILTEEGVTFDKQVLVTIVKKFAPDNRKILQVLQQYSNENGKVIDTGALGKLKGADQETLIQSMKAKDFEKVKGWCFDNADRLSDDFYNQTFKSLEPVVMPQSVPQLALTLNDYQRWHATVPDRFVHFLALMTQLMMELQFKP